MPIIDIIIAVAIILSVIIGFIRGFVKEALYFGPVVGELSESWLQGAELQTWFGRILVFVVLVAVGGLIEWAVSKAIKMSPLGGIDRFAGSLFGLLRGLLLTALFVLAGGFLGFDNDAWWEGSALIPHFEV